MEIVRSHSTIIERRYFAPVPSVTLRAGRPMIRPHPTRAAMRAPVLAKETLMARLRHFAVVVSDVDKAAAFYHDVFELERIGREDLEIGSAIYMSDGVINLALLNFTGKAGSKASDLAEGSRFVGAHHFGFQVDDLAETQKRIEFSWRQILLRSRRRTARQF